MTALQALFGRGQPAALSLESPAVPLTSTTLLDWLGGTPTHSGITVTEHGSLAIPAVWRAVTLISGVCAAMPLHAYAYGDAGRLPLAGGPEAELIADPHPDMTPLELWELTYGSLCLWGNAFLQILRDQSGQVRDLWWLAPSRVKVLRADDQSKRYIIDGDTDNARTDATILHVPGFGYDGVCGVGPIRLARQGLGLTQAAEQFGASLFGRGALAAGILVSENRLDDGQAADLRRRWREQGGQGLDGAHDIRVLGSGAKYQQLTIPPEDAQFLQTRQFQLGEIERMFGLPPHLLADTEKSTSWGTGIESQNLGLIQFTLAPYYLARVEQRVTRLLKVVPRDAERIPTRGRGTRYARYNVTGLLRGDAAARSAFYTALWQLGALSTNDIRGFEDMGPVEGGDVRYRPLNMGVLGAPVPADPAAGGGTGGGTGDQPAEATAAEAALAAANAVQKVYLGVGKVITDEEAREIVRRAGAGDALDTGPLPDDAKTTDPAPTGPPAPAPAPAADPAPPADGEVPADA